MDESFGTSAEDQTGSAPRLIITNVAWGAGRFGPSSLRFHGQEPGAGGGMACISNTNYALLPPNGQPFALSFWFAPENLVPGFRTLAGTDANGSSGWHLGINTAGPGTNYLVLAATNNNTSLSVTGRTLLLPNQWHKLTISTEGTASKMYLDAELLARGHFGLPGHQGPLYLGAVPGIAGSLPARIDELRTFTNALSAEQVSLSGYWRFDEGTGEVAADGSLQGRLASLSSNGAWAIGRSGTGVDLASARAVIGNEQYNLLPASGGAFSISAWVRPHALTSGRYGLFSCAEAENRGWQAIVLVESSGKTWMEFSSDGLGGTLRLRAPATFVSGVWTKVDLTYNGAIGTLYLDGRKVGSDSGGIQSVPAAFIVGSAPGATNFNGLIDELKVYTRERTESEIGPVALPLWEMALINSSTNLVLPGAGPPGKPLIYTVLPAPSPTRGTITYSPGSPLITYQAGAQKGPDLFVYTVSDGEFTSAPATGIVSVVRPHWVSPLGGPLQPQDGSIPERSWAGGTAAGLDAIWRTNNYYECFFYAPGEYQTTGWRFMQRSTANPGCKHIGSGRSGSTATVIKLVDTWRSTEEGVIFSILHETAYADSFEVRNMVLDCNAENNPKYVTGEPVWLRIPLTSTARVDTVSLNWSDRYVTMNGAWLAGGPGAFAVCARIPGPGGFATNCLALTSSNRFDIVTVGTNCSEIEVQLTRRRSGVHFYGIEEVNVGGGAVSLPVATSSTGGESRLDAQHPVLLLADQDASSSWASGLEPEVQITLPLEPGSAVTQVQLQWNCQTLADLKRLGPAAQYLIYARHQNTGQLRNIPFASNGRSAGGREVANFSTNSVVTDQLVLVLTAREPGVDYYSLREVTVQNGSAVVPLRVPKVLNRFSDGYSCLRAFDGDPQTAWVSGTQGSVTAIEVRGSHLKFTDLTIVGFGTKVGRECFPLSVLAHQQSASSPPPIRNVLVEDCLVTRPASQNFDGLSAIVVWGPGLGSIYNAVSRRCSVIGMSKHFGYSHAFTAAWIEDCYVDDCNVGVYYEPVPALSDGRVLIRSNLFQNVDRAISADFHPGAQFDSIVCIGNEMVLTGSPGRIWGVGGCDVCSTGASGHITNLTALNNLVRYPDWAPRSGTPDVGFLYSDIEHAVFANNLVTIGAANSLRVRNYPAGLVPGKTTPEDCDHPGLMVPGPSTVPPSLDALLPGYRRAWYNNRDVSGSLLPVRHKAYGVDGLAVQQQWTE